MPQSLWDDVAEKVTRTWTTPSTSGRQLLGSPEPSIRDIVERGPDQVSEVWCRKIFRHVLQSLEQQYAMGMPHRPITPDTVVFDPAGVPVLLLSVDEPVSAVADDLTALASTVHYAITGERQPAGPLQGRKLAGYSDSLITAVDRSMAPDPANRPQTIKELRDILGIVSPVQALRTRAPGGHLPQLPVAPAREASPRPGSRHWLRGLFVANGLAVLLAMMLGSIVYLRNHGPFDNVGVLPSETPTAMNHSQGADDFTVTTPTQLDPTLDRLAPANSSGNEQAANARSARKHTGSAQAVTADAEEPGRQQPADTLQPALTASPAKSGPGTRTASAPSIPAATARTPSTAPVHATYLNLRIQPWGFVSVDGEQRGVSPPLKRLMLEPGRHAILVINPNAGNRRVEIDTADGNKELVVNFDNDSAR